MNADAPRTRRWLVIWLGYWLALAIATHLPPSSAVPLPGAGFDRIVHGCCFLILTLLAHAALDLTARGHAILWGGIFLCYAGVDEWTQKFSGRTPDPWDWAWDAIGVVVGLIAVRHVAHLRRGRK